LASILRKIVANTKKELEKRKKELPLDAILTALVSAPPTRPFRAALQKAPGLALIAEIKKTSPSKGILLAKVDAKKMAEAYESAGAHAVSIVTDEKFFQGSGAWIAEAKKSSNLPVLRKDFIIDPYQIYESRYLRADAVLLIAALYPLAKELKKMVRKVNDLSMTPVVEVHTLGELERAIKAEADVIGINNRDLATFKVDIKTTAKLSKKIPKGKILISESGITSAEDAAYVHENGARAILVGESLIKAKHMAALVKELIAVGQE
jgi:indole-3-glycerol phosphate synthase